jgi:Coenzyme PQQ synthesis protein D (PqqD)
MEEEVLTVFEPDGNIRPRRISGILENALWEGTLLYLPGKELAVSLNSSAKTVWDLCDGRQNIAEIAREIGGSIGCRGIPPPLLDDVRAAVMELKALGLVESV